MLPFFAAVLSELDVIFPLKEHEGSFSGGQHFFSLYYSHLSKRSLWGLYHMDTCDSDQKNLGNVPSSLQILDIESVH